MALLEASLGSAREIGMRALEERAAARLNELSPTPRSATPDDDLTAREAEVLRLIAIGRSNADIAMALSISLNTVATHVRNILAKTGCANRTEAAAYAMRRGAGAPLTPHSPDEAAILRPLAREQLANLANIAAYVLARIVLARLSGQAPAGF
jgi:DNA-binding CsgD family transcriptional regulator